MKHLPNSVVSVSNGQAGTRTQETVCPCGQTDRQTDTHTDTQTDRHTDRQTEIDVCTLRLSLDNLE